MQVGVDLADLYRGTMTPRRLWVLIKNLPAESAFYRALRVEEAKAEAKARVQSIDDTLNMFQKRR